MEGCSPGAQDYGIYEGTMGSWTSHTAVDCHDDSYDLAEIVTPSPGDRYYLVVPRNPNDEGSYGTASSGAEIPQGTTVCIPTQVVGTCP